MKKPIITDENRDNMPTQEIRSGKLGKQCRHGGKSVPFLLVPIGVNGEAPGNETEANKRNLLLHPLCTAVDRGYPGPIMVIVVTPQSCFHT